MRFGELTIVCRCVNRNFCNGRGEITRSRNNRLTFKKDSRGFLVSPLHICRNLWVSTFSTCVFAYDSLILVTFQGLRERTRRYSGSLLQNPNTCQVMTMLRILGSSDDPCYLDEIDDLDDLDDLGDLVGKSNSNQLR